MPLIISIPITSPESKPFSSGIIFDYPFLKQIMERKNYSMNIIGINGL